MSHDILESQPVGVRAKRLAVVLLLLINLFNYIDRYVAAAVEPQIRRDLLHPSGPAEEAVAKTKTGSLQTAFLFTYMLAAPIFGLLADRMRRWLIVGLAVILWSLATGASGFAGTFGLLLAARVFVGIGEAGYGPTAPTIIADLYPVERRGSVLAWFYMAIPLGAALGYAIGAIVLKFASWHYAFFVVTPWGIALGLWAIFMKDPPRKDVSAGESQKIAPPRQSKWEIYLSLARNKSYLLNTAAMAAMTFAIGGISWWMPAYLEDRKIGGSSGIIFGGITAAAGIVATLLGGYAGDALRKKFGGAYFIVSGLGIFAAAPFIVAMLYMPFPSAWVMVFFAEFFLFFNTGPSNTALANVTHPSIRATAFALNILLIHVLGDAISPPILGAIQGKWNWEVTFFVVAGVMVISGALWLWGAKYLQADTEAAEA